MVILNNMYTCKAKIFTYTTQILNLKKVFIEFTKPNLSLKYLIFKWSMKGLIVIWGKVKFKVSNKG